MVIWMEGFWYFLIVLAAIILSALIFVIRNRHMEELFPSTYQASVKYVLKDAAGGYGYDLSLIVPEDMPIGVTAFELMAGDQVIGEKTPSAEVLRDIEFPERSRHRLHVRLYDLAEVIADVGLDPDEPSGALTFEY